MLSGFKRTQCMQQGDAQTMAIVFHGSTCMKGNQRVMIILDEKMKVKKYKKCITLSWNQARYTIVLKVKYILRGFVFLEHFWLT